MSNVDKWSKDVNMLAKQQNGHKQEGDRQGICNDHHKSPNYDHARFK